MAAKKKTTTTKRKAAPKRRKPATKRKATQPKAKKAAAPKPGTTITREFKGKTISVKVTADGFVHGGKTYSSLTALAIHITGYKAVSGPRFFGLVEPKAKDGTK